jgi:hypothetical protein
MTPEAMQITLKRLEAEGVDIGPAQVGGVAMHMHYRHPEDGDKPCRCPRCGWSGTFSRGKPNIRPPTRGVELGQWRPSACCSPRRPARRLGRLHGCGACRPQTPCASPPVRSRARAPHRVDQARGGWAQGGWATLALSTLRSNPLFNTKRGKFLKRGASEARQARRAAPCGQRRWEVWGCGQLCCPQVHADPPLSIG